MAKLRKATKNPATKFAESTASIKPIEPAGLPRKILKPASDDDDPTGALGPRKAVPIPSDAKWISAKQVCARYGGRSLMWLVRQLKSDPDFPKPTYFGPLRYWQPAKLDTYDDLIIQRQLRGRLSKRSGFAASA